MIIRFVTLFVSLSLFLICCQKPTEISQNDSSQVISREGNSWVYSINEIQKDSLGDDSILGVMAIYVGYSITIRGKAAHVWKYQTEYYTGRAFIRDSLFRSNDYIYENDSFLIGLAYSIHSGNSGLLLKRTFLDPTDSALGSGDSICIENEDYKFLCKHPLLGFHWNLRPYWLQYDIVSKESIIVWQNQQETFKITATPLDSHPVVRYSGSYVHNSWVTPAKIIKTEISVSIPDTITRFSLPKYYRIELLQEFSNLSGEIDVRNFKSAILQKGW